MAGLVELWRWKHPNVKGYSHISLSHGSSARIDLAFGNARTLQYVIDVEYLAGGLSDHNPLSLTLSFSTGPTKGGWRLLPSWLQHEQVETQLVEAIKSYWSTNIDSSEPPVVWDTFKAVVRGECISAIKTARVNDNEILNTLKQKERESAEKQVKAPTKASYEAHLEARRALPLHIKGLTRTELKRNTHTMFA